MTKIVYSACYGGFGLSKEAVELYAKLKGITLYSKGEVGSYYLCPIPEYERALAKDYENPVGVGRFENSNALHFSPRNIDRTDPYLVEVVETLGEVANSRYSNLRVAEVAEGTLYKIDEYDGFESVCTVDDYDWKVA